jgi:1-deoxyxylulose-5-phosphate synthase
MIYGSIEGVGNRVSRLVLGSLALNLENMELSTALLDRFVAAGGTAIDTARSYARGASEQAIGAWIRLRGHHDDVVIVTKGAHHHSDGLFRVTPEAIDDDVAGSLAALGVPTIDLYLLHRDNPAVPVGPIVECLNRHQAAGRLRAFGGSNWSQQRLAEANDYAASRGLAGFVASSPNLALAVCNEPMWVNCISVAGDRAALAWYRERQFPLLAWSSQASGFFSGRFAPDEIVDANVARVYYREDNWERLRRAREVAQKYGCRPTQVALAWVLRQDLPTFALIGPRTVGELDDCLGALEVPLTAADAAWLNLE